MCVEAGTLAQGFGAGQTEASTSAKPRFEVRKNGRYGYYITELETVKYLHRDFSLGSSMKSKDGGVDKNYHPTRAEAEEHVTKFLRQQALNKSFNKAFDDVVAAEQQNQALPKSFGQPVSIIPRKANNAFLIDHDKGEVEQLFAVRLVHNDIDNGDVTLEIATPHSEEAFVPLARLEFKGGRVVMYREKGAFDPYIETDEEGRIQN